MGYPRILITMNDATDYDGVKLRRDYARRLIRAGGLPLSLPHGAGEEDLPALAQAYINSCDGLLLSGGDDLEPELYGQSARRELEVYPQRDRLELALFQAAWEAGRPIFGICRGMQLINVALGGELYQDLDLDFQAGANARHHRQADERYQTHHEAEVCHPGLASLLGCRAQVNSHHHQAVSRLALPLQGAAYAPDGLCEAVIAKDWERRPLLAVQWHPECMETMQILFDKFVEQCS